MKSHQKLLPELIMQQNNLSNKLAAVKNRINVPLSAGHLKLIVVSCCFIVALLNLLLFIILLWWIKFSAADINPATPIECPMAKANNVQVKCEWGQKGCYEDNYWKPSSTYILQTNRGRTIIFEKEKMSRHGVIRAQWPFQIWEDGKFPYFEIKIVKNSCLPDSPHNKNFIGIGVGGTFYYNSYGYLMTRVVPVKKFGFEGDIVGCGLHSLGSSKYEIFFTNNGKLIDDKFIFNVTNDFDGKFFASVGYNIGNNCDLRFETNFGDNIKKEPFKFDIGGLNTTEAYYSK